MVGTGGMADGYAIRGGRAVGWKTIGGTLGGKGYEG